LAVFATSLPIALPRKGAESAIWFTHAAEGEHEIYPGVHAIDTFTVLFRGATTKDHCAAGFAEPTSRLTELDFRNTCKPLDMSRMVLQRDSLDRIESVCPPGPAHINRRELRVLP